MRENKASFRDFIAKVAHPLYEASNFRRNSPMKVLLHNCYLRRHESSSDMSNTFSLPDGPMNHEQPAYARVPGRLNLRGTFTSLTMTCLRDPSLRDDVQQR